MESERRRCDRLTLTIPLQISGTDVTGSLFDAPARSVSLNRHGVRVQIPRHLRAGEIVRLKNTLSRREADFRVVGPLVPPTEKCGEYGLECVDSKANVWGIEFPPLGDQTAESKGLLECRSCHIVALLALSLVEAEVLSTAGLISKLCQKCGLTTPWGPPEKPVGMNGEHQESATVTEAASAREAKNPTAARQHQRVCLQLPVLIRDYFGGTEISKTENVSKTGFCFVSANKYHVGQGVAVVCPYSQSSLDIELLGKITRRYETEGTEWRIYGVRYDSKGN
jgi:PilZ domain-containing protein